jgi:[ribosomal protein S5]-alanine N-acetyltransferase
MSAITTRRLVLRPVTVDDVDALWRLWTDADVRRYLWDDIEIPRERAFEVVEQSVAASAERGLGYFTISLPGHPELIGFTGLVDFIDPPRVEILYGLYPKYWGYGYATEASAAMLRRGFDTLGLERIFAGTDPPNAASVRVMERLGMTFAQRAQVHGLEVIYYVAENNSAV